MQQTEIRTPNQLKLDQRVQEVWRNCYPDKMIPTVSVEISKRLRRSAGNCRRTLRYGNWCFEIRLSQRYHDHYGWDEELNETLKHELIHVRHPNCCHGDDFRTEMQRVSAERFCKSPDRDDRKRKVYQCRACEHTFISMAKETECPKCEDLIDMIGTVEYDGLTTSNHVVSSRRQK